MNDKSQLLLDETWIMNNDEKYYAELFDDPLAPAEWKPLDEILAALKAEFDKAHRKWKECDA